MATAFLSDQLTDIAAGVKLKSNVSYGRARRIYFTKTLPGSGLATGDSIALCTLPKGARVLGGKFNWSATQGATATSAVGYAGATGRYFAAAVTASAATFALADTQAQNYGDELAADQIILITNAAAAWTVSTVLMGHIEFLVD